jgi:hypothetical protein
VHSPDLIEFSTVAFSQALANQNENEKKLVIFVTFCLLPNPKRVKRVLQRSAVIDEKGDSMNVSRRMGRRLWQIRFEKIVPALQQQRLDKRRRASIGVPRWLFHI